MKLKVLVKKCETVAGWICKHRVGYKCEKCGSPVEIQWAHIISRTYKRIKFDLDNCICLCKACHRYFTDRPVEWEIWITGKIGYKKYRELQLRAIDYKNKKRIDYEAIYERLLVEWNQTRNTEATDQFFADISRRL